MYIYSLMVGFPFHLSHHRALSREFPVLYSRFLLVIYFTHSLNSICMSVPISQFLSWLLYKTVPWKGLPKWLSDKESACNTGDAGSIPGLRRSPPEGNGNPLQDSRKSHWQRNLHPIPTPPVKLLRGLFSNYWVHGVSGERGMTLWLNKNNKFLEKYLF